MLDWSMYDQEIPGLPFYEETKWVAVYSILGDYYRRSFNSRQEAVDFLIKWYMKGVLHNHGFKMIKDSTTESMVANLAERYTDVIYFMTRYEQIVTTDIFEEEMEGRGCR